MMAGSRSSRFTRIAGKELKETLRDRRTLITLFLMPVLLYPLLSLIMNRMLLGSGLNAQRMSYRIGVLTTVEGNQVLEAINVGRVSSKSKVAQPLKILWSDRPGTTSDESVGDGSKTIPNGQTPRPQQLAPSSSESESSDVAEAESLRSLAIAKEPDFSIHIVEDGELEAALRNHAIDVAVRASIDSSKAADGFIPMMFSASFREGDASSENAIVELRRLFGFVNEAAAFKHRVMLGIPDAIPIQMVAKPSASSTSGSSGLAGIVPLILILMTITGGVYPAIDLTAGERERGTLEALIASPISRFQLVASKYVAVVSVSILTALINLLAMAVTLKVTGVGDALMGKNGMDWTLLLRIVPLLAVFAMFFSSILVALCSFARSFKEAQAYLIPIMLLSLGPGIMSLMPTIKLTAGLAVLPQVNLILLARDTLNRSDLSLSIVSIVILTTMFYTLAALAIAAKGFGDQVATAGDDFRWSDLLKRPEEISQSPKLANLLTYLSLFFPLYFVVTSSIGNRSNQSLQSNIVLNAFTLFALFLLLPLAYSMLIRVKLTSTYRWTLGPIPLSACLVSILFAATLWMFAFEILRFSDLLGIKTLSDEVIERTKQLREYFVKLPWWLVMLTMAVAPAIAEEFFFRGFVLSSLTNSMNRNRAVWISAALFGLFHVVNGSVLAIERFLPTAMLGVFLGFLAIYSRSIFPGMILHAGHNGLLFSLPYIDDLLKQAGFDRENGRLPFAWLLVGGLIVAAAFVFLQYRSRWQKIEPESFEHPT